MHLNTILVVYLLFLGGYQIYSRGNPRYCKPINPISAPSKLVETIIKGRIINTRSQYDRHFFYKGKLWIGIEFFKHVSKILYKGKLINIDVNFQRPLKKSIPRGN